MTNMFSQVLNMSVTGSVVILIVMLARWILKRSPKIFSYALWSVVLFRLLCPVAITAPVSVLNAFGTEVRTNSAYTSIVYYLPAQAEHASEFAFVPGERQAGPQPETEVSADQPEWDLLDALSRIWVSGAAVMLLYSAFQYLLLKRRLVGAIVYRGNVYLADYIDTAFVMGILRPVIYLPSHVPKKERRYIIAHERHHIRRCDHILKLLAYFALCVHWFNPLVWAAFILAGKDMEMSCDEAVIRRMGPQIRADYSASLLRLATRRRIIAGMPLAFGEGDTKGRVINMAKWKKPKVWVSVICLLLCAVILVACAVNPETADSTDSGPFTGIVTADRKLNIREEPETIAEVVGDYDNGTVVSILETRDGWGRTDKGWIALDYVTAIDSTAVTPTEQQTDPVKGSPVVNGSNNIVTDTELVQYGTLKLLLGPGFTAREQDGSVVLVKDSVDIGGITHYPHPGFAPDDMMKWIRALGLPELAEDFGVPIGYMAGNSAYGELEIEIFQDGAPEMLCEEHIFFIDGDIVYDVWYDENQITDADAEWFLKTVTINEEPVVAAAPDEEASLAKCREVLEAVQAGSYHVIAYHSGDNGPAPYETEFLESGEDWLTVSSTVLNTGETEQAAHLYAEGHFFSNQGHLSEAELVWEEVQDAQIHGTEGFTKPWLAAFSWREDVISYQGAAEQDGKTSVLLRIDERYPYGYDSDAEHYFVNFTFHSDGSFMEVHIQGNLFMENAFTQTEYIASLDPESVKAEIQAEYLKTMG